MDVKPTHKVLVVDDEPNIVELLQYNLEKTGYEVKTAYNGQEALDIARQYIPDLIILDIMMPKMDGYQVIRRLKEEERTSTIPVIFLTAKAQMKDVVSGRAMGADDYVVKPYKFNVLYQKILDLLSLH